MEHLYCNLNPYPLIDKQLTKGLDVISKFLQTSSSEEDLANVIFKYIQSIYYSESTSVQTKIELNSVVFNIINAYINQKIYCNIFNYQQLLYVDIMLDDTINENKPINELKDWLTDIEDKITSSKLSIDEQMPLILGIEYGKSIYDYWLKKVDNHGYWGKFFQTELSKNYINIPYWLIACMEGALIGASGIERGLIAPTTDIVSVEIVSSLIGALTLGSGKVIFKWLPKIQHAQFSGGFSEVLNDQTTTLKSSNKLCTNRRKCTSTGTNTCVNKGPCTNSCTNNCPIK